MVRESSEKGSRMGEGEAAAEAVVEQMPAPARSTFVSDELNRIAEAVRAICPDDAHISFEFERRLQINVDIRKLEDLARVEMLLPSLCGGIFSNVQRGLVDNRPFLHRLIAIVAR
jgi:hypothetical protein